MKKFIQYVAAFKTIAAFAFTGGIMLVTVASMFLRKDTIPVGVIWQAIFLSLIYGVLQYVAFSENVFPRMLTLGRLAVLGFSMLAALAVFALVFQWFPAGKIMNWLIFIGVYVAVFAIAAAALRIVFHLGGLKYSEMLTAYQAKQSKR